MEGADVIRVERMGDIRRVTLARPEKMNALNAALVEHLLDIVANSSRDGTRLLVIEGAGKNFSAGFDFSNFEAESEGDLLRRFVRIEQLLQAVYHAPFETAAFAHGRNFGAGVDLFCVCNRRFAAPGATFRMPGLQFGIVLGTRRFANIVGESRARSILHASETFDTEKAIALGVIETIADPATWPAFVESIAKSSEALPAAALNALCERTRTDTRADDLRHLVMSASQPGLKDRIRRYLDAQRAPAKPKQIVGAA